jgi:hypothetical protein
MASFDSFVPSEWIKDVLTFYILHNKFVQEGKESWWYNLIIYDDKNYYKLKKLASASTLKVIANG